MKNARKIISLTLAAAMCVFTFAGCKKAPTKEEETQKEKQMKVAVVRNLPSDDHTKQFLDGCVSEGKSFGYKVDTFISNGDDAKFQELVSQAIQKNYDGLIISHGKAEYSYDMLKPAIDKGMKVVTFDTVALKDGKQLDKITSTAQDDKKLAELSLAEIANLSKDGKPVKVIKVWFGPGIPPLDRRNEIYKKFEADNKITTLETVGPTNMDDVQGDIATKMSAILAKYPAGTVDAIWGSWDEMAKGANKAVIDAKRTDITLISIDVSNQDINLMREPGSIWKATAAVDPKLIGIVNMRLLAKKFKGEETPATYDLEAKLIKSEQLKSDTTMLNLNTIVPGWGVSTAFDEPWMKELRDKNK